MKKIIDRWWPLCLPFLLVALVAAATHFGTIAPRSDDTYDLGSTSLQWRNLYLDGAAYIDAIGETLTPLTDDTYDLGSSSYQWKDLYVDGVAYIDAIGESLVSDTDNTDNLGSSSIEWKDLYIDGVAYIDAIGESLVSDTDNTDDLGSSSIEWKDLYIDGVAYIDAIGENLVSDTDNTDDLGSSSIEWKDLYIDGVAYVDSLNVDKTNINRSVTFMLTDPCRTVDRVKWTPTENIRILRGDAYSENAVSGGTVGVTVADAYSNAWNWGLTSNSGSYTTTQPFTQTELTLSTLQGGASGGANMTLVIQYTDN